MAATFQNPFNGRCIHGVEGARFELGKLVNPNCAHCAAPIVYSSAAAARWPT